VDATCRQKRDQESRGQTIHVNETAHPDNQLNLITDVAVAPNNTDDGKILNARLEKMVEKTPDLDELHTDGAYGNEDNDRDGKGADPSYSNGDQGANGCCVDHYRTAY